MTDEELEEGALLYAAYLTVINNRYAVTSYAPSPTAVIAWKAFQARFPREHTRVITHHERERAFDNEARKALSKI